MLRTLLVVVAFGSAMLTRNGAAVAADKATVALTTTTNPAVADGGHKLAGSLAALLEVQLLADDSLSVVERQQIDLALQKLALSRSRSAAESLQLGKLVTADMLVMLELRRRDGDKAGNPFAMLRLVASKTAAIRGITVASDINESTLDEIAEQFARYVSTVIHQPQPPPHDHRGRSISDGLWLRDRLWLATTQGRCMVTPRDGLKQRTPDVPTREKP